MSKIYLELISAKLKELEKTRSLRLRYLDEKLESVKTLRRILEQKVEKKTCRLCLKSADLSLFDGTHDDLLNHIKNILGIELTKDESKPQHICSSCVGIVTATVKLKLTAEATQRQLQQNLKMVAVSTLHTDITQNDDDDNEMKHDCNINENGQDIVCKWSCSKCKRTFHNIEKFRKHVRMYTCRAKSKADIRDSFLCETCGAAFANMFRLKRHRQIHTGEFPYACKQCPYRARARAAMLIHERLHTGSRPLLCPYCPKTFASPSNLLKHRMSHFPPSMCCDTCKKCFRTKRALMDHITCRHRGVKPYICNICEQSFSSRRLLNRHELKTHKRPKKKAGRVSVYMQFMEENKTDNI